MTARKITVLVCDDCGSDELGAVETHQVTVDGRAIEAEICQRCWQKLCAAFAAFATHGRALPLRTPARAKPFPGTTWKFSSHALVRLGERHIDPMEILPVVEDPTITRPGRASDLEIREKGNLKVVVAPERGVIITVAKRSEDDDTLVLIEGRKSA